MSDTLTPPSFQNRVLPWMLECFGPTIPYDKLERGDRLLEEVLELLQSGSYPKQRIAALVEYVYDRDIGEPKQEVGGVMVTLAAYCLAHEVDMHEAAETELARVWTKVEQIRAKQASKPTGSALPIAADGGPSQQELAAIGQSVMNWIDLLTPVDGPLKDWTPAESPAEVIPDLYNMLEESLACHRQACGEAKQLAEALEAGATGSMPDGFRWIDKPITVTGGDYAYEGQLLCSFPKDEESNAIRYIVRDQNRRLFIHNAQQCGLDATI
ncbi:hypothetical protein ACC719_29540 [Rhizobium ruizarguesonis]